MLTADNAYTRMQKNQYETEADLMNEENHRFHDANPDYWNILLGDTEVGCEDKTGLDFGCGCGRNVQNLWKRFGRMDGVDISSGNLAHARENLRHDGCPDERSRLFGCNGVDLSEIASDDYDFVMSTIVLQHICVHQIRFNYLREFFRVLKPGGMLSFQMGFGEGYGKAEYYDNHYHAQATNTLHDTKVTDPAQIQRDLEEIGFTDFWFQIAPRYSDGHPNWIFVKAYKPGASPTITRRDRLGKQATVTVKTHGPRLHLLMPPQKLDELGRATVTYQQAQFAHLPKYADVSWHLGAPSVPTDATVCFDERTLLCNADDIQKSLPPDSLFVLVTHDYWCHPLRVAEFLRRQKRSLLVLRHESARQLFRQIAPEIPAVVQRPGVEVSLFQPVREPKRYDIILSGSETPDYPVRQRLNRIVRENATAHGWSVLDLATQGTMSNPDMTQAQYAPLLASAKVSPTGTNRGGGPGAKLVIQYFDLSAARAGSDDDFYGFAHPEVVTRTVDTAGVTPRYLESMATKTLLVGDLPEGEAESWYADKMVVVTPDMTDETIVSVLDYVIRDDQARTTLCDYAHQSVLQTETSDHRAKDLAEIIARSL